MPELLKVIILAIIEGVTEFLPVSSTGHLIVVSHVVALNERYRTTFDIFVQLGAVVAVIVFYRAELWQQLRAIPSDEVVQQFWLKILVAFLPAAGLGFLLGDWISSNLFNPTNVALALIAGGVLFIFVETRRPVKPLESTRAEVLVRAQQITFQQALVIGLWQLLALIPGMSRSGMTIMGGMLTGIDRAAVTMFTFYLAIPTLGLATIYTLLKDLSKIAPEDLTFLILGAVIAGLVAYASIGWLLRYVSHNTFIPFGVYRIVLGVIILALVAAGML